MSEPTRGQRRAAITSFRQRVRDSWEQNGAAFARKYPEFALFARRLEEQRLRVNAKGDLLVEPAFALELDHELEKLNNRIDELEERLAGGGDESES